MNDILELSKQFRKHLIKVPVERRVYILFGLLVDNSSTNDIATYLALLNVMFTGIEAMASNKEAKLVYSEASETLESFNKFTKEILAVPSTKTLIEDIFEMTKYEKTH